MGQIIISNNVDNILNELTQILYNKNYFGFQKSADNYVQLIRDFIETIPNKPLKLCKNPYFGKYYARYDVAKSKMQYFITYEVNKNRYYIVAIILPKTEAYLAIFGV